MRQTIKTKSYNATIQIPYEKLAKPHNHCIPLSDLQPSSHNNNNGKTLCIQTCHPNNNNNNNEDTITIRMLEELEQAFDSDMRDKDRVVQGLREDVRRGREQLGVLKGQAEKYRNATVENEKKYLQAVRTIKSQDSLILQYTTSQHQLQHQLHHLTQQSTSLTQQLSQLSLLKSQHQQQINSLKQKLSVSQYRNKTQQQQINKLSQSLQKVSQSCQKYEKEIESMLREKEGYVGRLGQMEEEGRRREGEIRELGEVRGRLEADVLGMNGVIEGLNRQVEGLHGKVEQLNSTIQQQQTTIQKQQQQLTTSLQTLSTTQKQLQKQTQASKILANTILTLQSTTATLHSQLNTLQHNYNHLLHNSQSSQHQLQQLTKSNSMFVKKIVDLENYVRKLQVDIREKEVPRNFDVKIEKVVDRREYIEELEGKLESMNAERVKYGERIRELERVLGIREREVQDKGRVVGELQKTIMGLKQYIEQKEKSFAWIVQRQIAKDIQLNNQTQPPTYKVYPTSPAVSKPGQSYSQPPIIRHSQQPILTSSTYSRIPGNYNVADGRNIIIGGAYTTGIDNSNILGELEKAQFRDIVYREAQQFRRS